MRLALPLLLAVLPLAGCGGGGSRASYGSEGYVAAPPSIEQRGTRTLAGSSTVVELGEDFFRPTVIRAPAGTRLTLRLRNVGSLRHAFDVSGDGQKVDISVPSGGSATVHVRVPAVGRLLFFCKYHWSRGMAGWIEPDG